MLMCNMEHSYYYDLPMINNWSLALAGVAQWIAHQPENTNVASLIPSQGTCLGCGMVPSWGHVRGNQLMYLSHINVSFPLSLPSHLSKNK